MAPASRASRWKSLQQIGRRSSSTRSRVELCEKRARNDHTQSISHWAVSSRPRRLCFSAANSHSSGATSAEGWPRSGNTFAVAAVVIHSSGRRRQSIVCEAPAIACSPAPKRLLLNYQRRFFSRPRRQQQSHRSIALGVALAIAFRLCRCRRRRRRNQSSRASFVRAPTWPLAGSRRSAAADECDASGRR